MNFMEAVRRRRMASFFCYTQENAYKILLAKVFSVDCV